MGDNQNRFRVILRQSRFNPWDFSVILGVYPRDYPTLFHLKRYDGKSHEHTNTIEGETFYDFHIHTATERYQIKNQGKKGTEEGYAQPTDRFTDLREAIECMIIDCGFIKPYNPQLELFS
ncbi:MAG: hypothetical protein AB4058_06985 [Microcystaceae cyanobacterium]